MSPRRIAIAAALAVTMLFPSVALAEPTMETLTAVQTGINGGNLADTLTTSPIRMGSGKFKTELLLLFVVAPGTTVQVDVTCEEAALVGGPYHSIPFRPNASPAAIVQDIQQYPVDGVPLITNWSISIQPRAPFIRCTFDDAADGTGTVIVLGVLTQL